ncbi:MAG: hypothetical protein IIC89_09170, partial [Chloroflexi bacterium]|nr:hypothetical protein [Chloroflexota bacterium]
MRSKLMLLAGAAIVALAVACGGGGDGGNDASPTVASGDANDIGSAAEADESPSDAVKRLMEYRNAGQWGREWDDLHPAHQALLSRDEYMTCAADEIGLIEVEFISVVETYEEDISIPRTDL